MGLSMLWFCFRTIGNYLSFSSFSFFFFLSVFISLFDFYFLFRGELFFYETKINMKLGKQGDGEELGGAGEGKI